MLAMKRLPSLPDLPGRNARQTGEAGRDRNKDTQVTVTGMALAEPMVDDDTLLARIANGDRGAFTLLATRHSARALSVAQRVLNNAAEADEVVQEAWVKVWTKAGQWEAGGSARFSTWLHRVVVNMCIDRRRKQGFEALDDAPDVPDPAPAAGSLIARRQMSETIATALAGLPERQRIAVSLCYYEEMSAAEAGRALDLSVPAVESLLARARRALRGRLTALGITGVGED